MSSKHPCFELTLSINSKDYKSFGVDPPNVKPQQIKVLTDSGAKSCLWPYNDLLTSGFKRF